MIVGCAGGDFAAHELGNQGFLPAKYLHFRNILPHYIGWRCIRFPKLQSCSGNLHRSRAHRGYKSYETEWQRDLGKRPMLRSYELGRRCPPDRRFPSSASVAAAARAFGDWNDAERKRERPKDSLLISDAAQGGTQTRGKGSK